MNSRYRRCVPVPMAPLLAWGLVIAGVAAWAAGPPEEASLPQPGDKDTVIDGHVFHDVGQLWNHVTNFGLIGSQPSTSVPYADAPSARWPGEDGLDYLWSASLWVGATVQGEQRVTTGQFQVEFLPTAAADDTIYATARGASGGNRYPWPGPDDDGDGQENEDPLNNRDDDDDGAIDEDFAAIGNQHFRCVYSDTAASISEIYPEHQPLGIAVTQQTLQWSRPVADDFIGYDFTVTNVGNEVLDDVYIGLFADFDIPANGGAGNDDLAGSWSGEIMASDGSVVPIAVAYMADGAQIDPAPGYVGFVLCGHTTDPEGQTAPQQVAVRSFQIFGGNLPYDQGGDPSNDNERYHAMQLDQHDANTPPSAPDDHRVLIASGPFASLAPGEAITYQVGLVAGLGLEGLLIDAAAEAVLTYRGRNYDRDGDPANGAEFPVRWLRWEDEPVTAVPSDYLAPDLAVSPNPFNPRLEIRFALPAAGIVRLEVFDLRGRRVRTLLDEARPAGTGSVSWDGNDQTGRAAASGVYQLRLVTAGQLLEQRVTLVR